MRNAIGRKPSPDDYETARNKGPHALGEVLVAAVFDAWLQVYEDRTADLVRLATGGSGVLPQGAIPHDLAGRLAEEAAKVAGQFLNICIRALDYCPPVDPTFGEYLRALITADRDLVADDPRGYRVALVDGFRARGILPPDVQSWSPEAMVWQKPDRMGDLDGLRKALESLTGGWRLDGDRFAAWLSSRNDAKQLHGLLAAPEQEDLRRSLGLLEVGATRSADGAGGKAGRIEVHAVRPLRRVGPDGQVASSVVIEVTQLWTPELATEGIRGGCTVIWDRTAKEIRYAIYKRVGHGGRTRAQLQYRQAMAESGSARGNYFRPEPNEPEPFALLHSDH